jgi:hypothetical protein
LHLQVGAQPTRGELARAMADMLLVGEEGYHEKVGGARRTAGAHCWKLLETAGTVPALDVG